MVERKCGVGQHVVFTDSLRVRHDALITAWHGVGDGETVADFKKKYGENAMPCVNLVYVTKDQQKVDSYGLQLERITSVPHKSVQYAVDGAMTYCWPDEV